MPRIEIAATGNELLSGQIADTNSAWLAEQLLHLGLRPSRLHAVEDEVLALSELLREISSRADLALVTGGLGSTPDDVTVRAAAEISGLKLVQDPKALESIQNFWRQQLNEKEPPEEVTQQGYVPEKSLVLPNNSGLAPGFGVSLNGCLVMFLPGVPREMKNMFTDSALPIIREKFALSLRPVRTSRIRVFGISESAISRNLQEFPRLYPGVELGYRFLFPQIQLTLYADQTRISQEELSRARQWILERLGINAVSAGEESMAEVIGSLLRKQGQTLSLAESCTGGLIAAGITSVAGSSDYFTQAAVTYSNQAKTSLLGVSQQTLKEHGAVHQETAREMAEGVRRLSGSDYALSATGIAGPGGGTQEKPLGTLCLGLASPGGSTTRQIQRHTGSRQNNQRFFAECALDLLRRSLLSG